MPRITYTVEHIITKLREAEVALEGRKRGRKRCQQLS
jgi:hypothetical protein